MECVDYCSRDLPWGMHIVWLSAWYLFAKIFFEMKVPRGLLGSVFGMIFSGIVLLLFIDWGDQTDQIHALTMWVFILTPLWFGILSAWFLIKRRKRNKNESEPYIDQDITTGWAARKPFDHGNSYDG